MELRAVFSEDPVSIRTEFLAGVTTFLTSAYIIAVNPAILAQTGMDQKALIAVTCIASGIATLLMALYPKVPVLMAPGMGLNAFFTYTVVNHLGYSWQQALGFVFWAGALFLILSLLGIRQRIAAAIPINLRLAGSVGIGLFIAYLGVRNMGLLRIGSEGLPHLSRIQATQTLSLCGLLFMAILESKRIQGSLLAGIFGITAISILLGYSPAPSSWFMAPPSIAPVAGKLQLIPALEVTTILVILTFLYVALFDGIGTLLAVSEAAGISKRSDYERKFSRMMTADSTSNMIGAVLGTSTVTAYIESATGITQGGRSGWTAFFSAILFLAALFLVPIFAVIPAFATAPALVMVGVFMIREIVRIDFSVWDEALPAFLTILLMPLTTSIATGLMFGFISFTFLKILTGKMKDLNPILIGITLFSLINLIFGGRFV
jgi:AGZA family xanthine/uracil permease-like MFS transporter